MICKKCKQTIPLKEDFFNEYLSLVTLIQVGTEKEKSFLKKPSPAKNPAKALLKNLQVLYKPRYEQYQSKEVLGKGE